MEMSEVEDDYANDASTRGSVSANGFANGVIEYIGDRDFFEIDLEAGQAINIDAFIGDAISHRNIDHVGVFNGAAVELAFVNGGGPLSFTASSAGTYYILIADSPGTSGEFGGYTVAVADVVDDYADDNTTTGVIDVNGAVITAAVNGTSADVDYFAVTVSAGQTVIFNVTGISLRDPGIVLFDANDTPARF